MYERAGRLRAVAPGGVSDTSVGSSGPRPLTRSFAFGSLVLGFLVLACQAPPQEASLSSAASDGPSREVLDGSTKLFWGDTHVHSSHSGDAFVYGGRLTPDDAYRFAKGEAVVTEGGQEARLSRPLDFLMVADHAENLGVLPRLLSGDGGIEATATSRKWREVLVEMPAIKDLFGFKEQSEFETVLQAMAAAKAAHGADYGALEDVKRSEWDRVVATAQRHNVPGGFTTFVGYEWSGRSGSGPSTHRNVLFAGEPEHTLQVVPFSRFDSDDPEDLWAYLADYVERTGSDVIAIPHNSNLSRGEMFSLAGYSGAPMTREYAEARSRWEPLVEVTQIKGDSESHPLLSPDDEFAHFEPWFSFLGDDQPGAVEQRLTSYARSALKHGLDQRSELGANPFKFGMIGSTDAHTALGTADSDNFWGKMAVTEPSRYRVESQWQYAASGYAGVWAEENTRASLFAAMSRREVYATTGPRITVRFFGGWGFGAVDALRPDMASVGYGEGVPMGGDLSAAPEGESPSFLIGALKDPDGANLDRVQVVKGWRDSAGELREKIYDVALSDGRTTDASGHVDPVGSTVDVEDASYLNSIGDPQLLVVWTDPDFEAEELAFYYLRVLEIPTPRWTAYDAKIYGLEGLPDEIPMAIQERAYTSPIWYTPK